MTRPGRGRRAGSSWFRDRLDRSGEQERARECRGGLAGEVVRVAPEADHVADAADRKEGHVAAGNRSPWREPCEVAAALRSWIFVVFDEALSIECLRVAEAFIY